MSSCIYKQVLASKQASNQAWGAHPALLEGNNAVLPLSILCLTDPSQVRQAVTSFQSSYLHQPWQQCRLMM